MEELDLAVLYWFYKEPEVTKNHLEILRKHNPNRKIYGLFGGNSEESEAFRRVLGDLLDDFWTYPGTYGNDSHTKWIHGDLLILDWYDKRGRELKWDSITITQWDMLVLDDIGAQLPGLERGQVFFSGYRKLTEPLENRWVWTNPELEHRKDYDAFREYVEQTYGAKDILACLYLFEVLTRPFFDQYLALPDKKIGMLEYKDPTLALAWGMDIYEHDLGVYWQDWRKPEDSPLIATKKFKIKSGYIQRELSKADGWRIFHPTDAIWPVPHDN